MTNFINTTPHPITFRNADGSDFTVPPCGYILSAKPVETLAWTTAAGIELVRTEFEGTEEGCDWIAKTQHENPGNLIIGSIIAAQAYPGRVVAMTPASGFERVPVNEKRMNPDKFTIF